MIITYSRPNGGLSIVIPAPKATLEEVLGPLTDEAYRAHVLERSVAADAVDPQIMPDGWTPPANRTFRDAWKLKDQRIEVDMPKARDIHRDRLRAERVARLAALDIEALRALEAGDQTASDAVSQRKQKLRDAPAHPALEAAATPEQLAALTLDDLV